MAAFILFHEFLRYLGDKEINLGADTLKAVLTNTAPVQATDDALADITQIANGLGYTTGGVTLTGVTWAETGAGTGVWRLTCADFGWLAAGGALGPFQYVVLYDDTGTTPTDPLIGYLDYGQPLTLADGAPFTVDVGAGGLFTTGLG